MQANDFTPTPLTGRDETRERLLDTASRMFGEQGYARTSTRAIAAETGVSEMTLFRHFGSKEKLFSAVVDRYASIPDLTTALGVEISGHLEEDLVRLGSHLFSVIKQRMDVLRLVLSEASHFPEVREVLARIPRQLRKFLAQYLQSQIDQGTIRPMDTELSAQLFWGLFLSAAISRELLGEKQRAGDDELVRHYVDVFIHGIQA